MTTQDKKIIAAELFAVRKMVLTELGMSTNARLNNDVEGMVAQYATSLLLAFKLEQIREQLERGNDETERHNNMD